MKKILMLSTVILVLLLLACAPKAVPATVPVTSISQVQTPASTTIKVSDEDAAWQKVIEAAQKEGKASIYTFAYLGDTAIEMRNAFKARYNIQLDLISGRGAEITERLKTERRLGNLVADIAEGGSAHLFNMKEAGLLEIAQGLPTLRNKGDFHVDPLLDQEGYLLNENLQNFPPMVNTKLVQPGDVPKSWQDMLNPKWKGKMLAHSPQISTGMYVEFIPLLNAKAITVDFLREIGKQDLVFTRGDQETADKLARGEAPITLGLIDTIASSYVKEGAPIKAIPMVEGVTTKSLVVAQVKGGPHPNAARLFLNWILSPEGQTVYHKSMRTGSVRKDVPDFRPPDLTLPPGTKLVLETAADAAEEGKKFQEKWLPELWKK